MTYVALSIIEFTDGTGSLMPLHVGTREECERVADMIPAVSYSGDKTPKKSAIAIWYESTWDKVRAQEAAAQS